MFDLGEEFSAPETPLCASCEVVSVGETLEEGEGFGSFRVSGGPGNIVSASHFVEVSPEHFGPEETTILVRVRGLRANCCLCAPLLLRNASGKIVVDVAAYGGLRFQP